MACFTVPVAGAAVAAAAGRHMRSRNPGNPFAARLGWLVKMLSGGGFLLAIEHIYHGEVVLHPPFLTAAEKGPEAMADMWREIATRGTAMTALVCVAWAVMVCASVWLGKRRAAACAN